MKIALLQSLSYSANYICNLLYQISLDILTYIKIISRYLTFRYLIFIYKA